MATKTEFWTVIDVADWRKNVVIKTINTRATASVAFGVRIGESQLR